MSDGIYSALSGAMAQVRNLDTIANNMANASTVGFKEDRLTFKEQLSNLVRMEQTMQAPFVEMPLRWVPDDKRFTQASEVVTMTSQGAVAETGNSLDLAIVGEGYLAVETPQGVRYTRDGALRTDDEGRLVTGEGHGVQAADGGGLILPPGRRVNIDSEGFVSVDDLEVGQIAIVAIAGNIQKEGELLFTGNAIPAPEGSYELRQGYLEQSNVNPVRTMTELIRAHRSFETIQTLIQTFSRMDSKAINEVGKPTR